MKKLLLSLFLLVNLLFVLNFLAGALFSPTNILWAVLFVLEVVVSGVFLSQKSHPLLSLSVLVTGVASLALFFYLYFLSKLLG